MRIKQNQKYTFYVILVFDHFMGKTRPKFGFAIAFVPL
jgi:hypothetical protein